MVDGRGELRGQPRVPEGVRGDQQADPGARRDRGQRGEQRPALELAVGPVALVAQQVVVHPDGVEPDGLGVDHGIAQLGPGRPLHPERRAEPHPHLRATYRTDVPSAAVDQPTDRAAEARIDPAMRDAVLGWFDAHGRDLAFRRTRDPYAVLVSELMAQQTQIGRASDAWVAWMARFPTVRALADASPADVLRQWQGLGYNRRALNLHRAAKAIVADHGGVVPDTVEVLRTLPGIGPYTARAVAAIAFGRREGAVDTNVRRVLGRSVAGDPERLNAAELQAIADDAVPPDRPGAWTHALMDIGATCCRPARSALR